MMATFFETYPNLIRGSGDARLFVTALLAEGNATRRAGTAQHWVPAVIEELAPNPGVTDNFLMDVEDSLERAYALGAKNRDMLNLLNQHCAHAVDEKTSGRGMAEEASGLPIDVRTIRCPYAKQQVGSANNLEWIVVDFYRANCVGCPHRQLRGVPNLATYVADLDEESKGKAEADEQQERQSVAGGRSVRIGGRLSLSANRPRRRNSSTTSTSSIGLHRRKPMPKRSKSEKQAIAYATAAHAPETFTPIVVDQLRQLVRQRDRAWLFEVLSKLASSGHADRRDTLQQALEVLATNPSGEAAAVIVALRADLVEGDLSRAVLRSLVLLAGTRRCTVLRWPTVADVLATRAGSCSRSTLRYTACWKHWPICCCLGKVLPIGEAPLWLPQGAVPRDASAEEHQRDNDRASAAVAARGVLTAVPGSAGVLARQLMDSLNVPDVQDYGVSPRYEITETLARLLLEQPTLLMPLLRQAGATASDSVHGRLMESPSGPRTGCASFRGSNRISTRASSTSIRSVTTHRIVSVMSMSRRLSKRCSASRWIALVVTGGSVSAATLGVLSPSW